MSDIVDELLYEQGEICTDSLRQRAADEIGRLRTECQELRHAGAAGLELVFDQLAVNNRLIEQLLQATSKQDCLGLACK